MSKRASPLRSTKLVKSVEKLGAGIEPLDGEIDEAQPPINIGPMFRLRSPPGAQGYYWNTVGSISLFDPPDYQPANLNLNGSMNEDGTVFDVGGILTFNYGAATDDEAWPNDFYCQMRPGNFNDFWEASLTFQFDKHADKGLYLYSYWPDPETPGRQWDDVTFSFGVDTTLLKPAIGDGYGHYMYYHDMLGPTVLASSLTSVGVLTELEVEGTITANTDVNVTGTMTADTVSATTYIGLPDPPAPSLLPITLDTGNNRVGINDTTPSYSLDVNGTFRNTGNAFVGGDLDVTGNAVVHGDVDVTGHVHTTDHIDGGVITGTSLVGPLATAAQPNVTSVGTLTSLTTSGNLVVNTSDIKVDTSLHRLGVNTASPGYTLDVNGNTNITGNLIVSGTITGTMPYPTYSTTTGSLKTCAAGTTNLNSVTLSAGTYTYTCEVTAWNSAGTTNTQVGANSYGMCPANNTNPTAISTSVDWSGPFTVYSTTTTSLSQSFSSRDFFILSSQTTIYANVYVTGATQYLKGHIYVTRLA